MKPILFNTDMVRSILEGRKTVTRRVVKIVANKGEPVSHVGCNSVYYPTANKDGVCADFYDMYGFYRGAAKPPYQPGNILYVRETFAEYLSVYDASKVYYYKADGEPKVTIYDDNEQPLKNQKIEWKPSIHMPKEAARIFLRVTEIRAEQLQDITAEQTIDEGIELKEFPAFKPTYTSLAYTETILKPAFIEKFAELWDSTIKTTDRSLYGWAANPYVWVIDFERIDKEEATK